jgi:37-kD nucleoid-associated bacterial protein
MARINPDLSSLVIRRVIFHDVPNNPKREAKQPTLAEDETKIDAIHRSHLKTKLTRVLSSSHAYPVNFELNSPSKVPAFVREFTEGASRVDFVEVTQQIALQLFDRQHGGISPGLLCAIDVTSNSLRGLVLMKLEREEGAQIELKQHGGKKAFDMSVLDNLVLTQGTRLFKSAYFLRTGKGDDSFKSLSCDSQHGVTDSSDMSQFWLRFLGVKTKVAPRVATQQFYDSALQFFNDYVTDPVVKNDLYEHLQSQMKSEKRSFEPLVFVREFVPRDYQQTFKEHLESQSIATSSFTKDLSDISTRIKQKAYLTARGARVSVPAENSEIVDVEPDRIIVNDELLKVDRK